MWPFENMLLFCYLVLPFEILLSFFLFYAWNWVGNDTYCLLVCVLLGLLPSGFMFKSVLVWNALWLTLLCHLFWIQYSTLLSLINYENPVWTYANMQNRNTHSYWCMSYHSVTNFSLFIKTTVWIKSCKTNEMLSFLGNFFRHHSRCASDAQAVALKGT